MADKSSKTQRWLDFIAFLLGHRYPVTAGQIMAAVPAYAEKLRSGKKTDRESLRRMFERDKSELLELGVALETVPLPGDEPGEQFGYRLGARDLFLPYLKLVRGRRGVAEQSVGAAKVATVEVAPEAAAAALDALRFVQSLPGFPYAEEAGSAARKLSLDTAAEAPASPEVPVLFLDDAPRGEVVKRVRALSQALLARKRVQFRYHGIYRGEATERDVAPYGLMFQHGYWYLVGHDATRADVRVFRVERMEEPKPPDETDAPQYEIPEDFRLRDHMKREPWELGEQREAALRALVLFRFPMALWAARNRRGELVEERADGSQVRAFDVAQTDPFLRWILSLEGDAAILQPPELRAALGTLAASIANVHRAGATAPEGGNARG